MSFNVRTEEYAPLGDFLMASFARDLAAIEVRFKKMNAAYLASFEDQLDVVKKLEGTLKLTEDQKKATATLYAEADVVNKDLNFLSSYFKDAGLPTAAISSLKKNLKRSNIEGALLEMKDLRQYIVANQAALEEEGMDAGFPSELDAHRVSMEALNTLQNSVLNTRKQLVEANAEDYKALYRFVSAIAEKGKLVFKGTVVEDEYNITKLVGRMRAPKK
ncbi:hypothetical protein [Flavobacterium dankookense]|uniref:Uncharacterized protein n=1 Tax=Flavobacterium dankookense TaxID=706186 RepID=A0A4V3CSH7_9FLAO|nr:hypothetical protein [Flavobacterium dankookense]TDP60662.1 hypothetical protein BC748_0257 [Flavobacterium dankookense]